MKHGRGTFFYALSTCASDRVASETCDSLAQQLGTADPDVADESLGVSPALIGQIKWMKGKFHFGKPRNTFLCIMQDGTPLEVEFDLRGQSVDKRLYCMPDLFDEIDRTPTACFADIDVICSDITRQ